MKTYNLDEIKKLVKDKNSELALHDDANSENPSVASNTNIANYIYGDNTNKSYTFEEYDSAKTRILKYIFYKKRTESEVRKKFNKTYSEELLDDVIEELLEKGYINDESYVARAVAEFIAIRNLSKREIRFKLMAKGVKSKDIDTYFENNSDELLEYEIKSAKHIADKKKTQMEDFEIKRYLIKKGYSEESIKEAL